jgi:competence protein ComEC
LLVLLLDPWAVMAPGFWLSFAAVALIFYVTQSRPRPEGWLWQWGRVQGAMTLGLAPLTLVLFQQVSLVSPVANAIAIPVVSFVVTPLALIGAVLPWDLPLTLAHGTLSLLMKAMVPLAALGGAVWHQHAPVAWTLLPALAGVLWLLAPCGVPGRVLGLVLMLPLFSVRPPSPAPGEARMDVLDVGQGTAVVVRTANHALLYDAGPAWGSEGDSGMVSGNDSGARVVVPFLRGEGVDALDLMVISHDDNDHAGGGASVIRAYPGAWLVSSLAGDHPLQALARGTASCAAGYAWQWDGVRFTVLHPDRRESGNPYTVLNDRSCVLRVEAGRTAALLAGDIGRRGEEALLARGEPVRAEVLLVPHHGSATSSSPAFVDAVAPRQAVFSVGYRNRFGHPREDVVARYRQKGSLLLRTDRLGALRVVLRDESAVTSAYRQEARRYWRTE